MTIAADVPLPDVSTHPIDLRRTLAWYRHGGGDPTTQVGATCFVRACWTPDGPATTAIDSSRGETLISAWGPGQAWARRSAWHMTGADREVPAIPDVDPLVTLSAHRNQLVRTGASGDLYGALLPTILEQRITSGEAKRQWGRLCYELGEPAPGPFPGLLLPPAPERLAGRPAWWFHPLGIEAKRARTLTEVARIADRLWDWVARPREELVGLLGLVSGIGPWTIGSVLGPVCGDDDAVPVGDYHIPNLVAFNLAGEPRADDARMLTLLEPFHGVRGRVIRLLGWAGRAHLRTAHDAASFPCTDGDDDPSLRHPHRCSVTRCRGGGCCGHVARADGGGQRDGDRARERQRPQRGGP